ncbi:BnaC04g13630D [Brassica napus]|uniref:BnaC04g13630D protein n=2 Tax=Brassica TaxID=3705 RepID=A0A078GJI3_BRANA|nr:BnaC04g13630D [Brassica napus]
MIVFIIFFFSFLQSCVCGDMIMRRHSLRDGDVIFSERKRFAFGFFSSPLSKLRYVGIWYAEISEQTVVWVANRDRPVNDKSGLIKFTSRGNLCVYASSVNETEPVWSTNVSDSILEATLVAKLSDIGILVLLDLVTGRCFWESFDHPTDTFLPFMRLGFTRKDGLNRVLTSWRSPGDPGSGIFTYRIKRVGFPQLILYKGLIPWWRAGTWTGQKWSGVPGMTRGYIFNSSFVNNQDEVSITYGVTDASVITRMMVKETGNMQRFTWIARDKRWNGFWSAPKEDCDYYAHCGLNGYCDPTSTEAFECTCLPGFEPKMPRDWLLRDTSGGCTKKNYASICREKEGFVKLRSVKIPDTSNATVDMKITLEECENRCLRNCSCVAYASAYHESDRGATGCLTWHGGILDTRIYVNSGQDFYIRVDREEMVGWNRKGALGKMRAVFILISLIAAVMLLTVVLFCFSRTGVEDLLEIEEHSEEQEIDV